MPSTHRGVTLVELLTVLVVIAILAAIAFPSYRSFVISSQRADARTALLQVQAAEEKFYLQNNRYSDDVVGGLGLTGTSEHGLYTVRTDAGPPDPANPAADPLVSGYVAKATPVAGKGQDQDAKCTGLTIDSVGTKGSTGTATAAECWH
jgi:type IV pilus assembly protein PilE